MRSSWPPCTAGEAMPAASRQAWGSSNRCPSYSATVHVSGAEPKLSQHAHPAHRHAFFGCAFQQEARLALIAACRGPTAACAVLLGARRAELGAWVRPEAQFGAPAALLSTLFTRRAPGVGTGEAGPVCGRVGVAWLTLEALVGCCARPAAGRALQVMAVHAGRAGLAAWRVHNEWA